MPWWQGHTNSGSRQLARSKSGFCKMCMLKVKCFARKWNNGNCSKINVQNRNAKLPPPPPSFWTCDLLHSSLPFWHLHQLLSTCGWRSCCAWSTEQWFAWWFYSLCFCLPFTRPLNCHVWYRLIFLIFYLFPFLTPGGRETKPLT